MHRWNLLTATGRVFEYAGDAREFTPQAVNTKRSRLEQEVNIDFYKEKFSHMQMLVSSP